MDYQTIIDKYYPEDNALRHVLITHSQSVAHMALQIVSSHPKLNLDPDFVLAAAMLHDIGIFRCDAPGIYCYGTEPYICHGRIGAELLRAEGLPRLARVCERHTGAGITRQEIEKQHLPLPDQDFLPETTEENSSAMPTSSIQSRILSAPAPLPRQSRAWHASAKTA